MICPPRDFYPRSPCGERPVHLVTLSALAPISIHALLAESDVSPLARQLFNEISIHALLAESDITMKSINNSILLFLSTLSLRRATWYLMILDRKEREFLSTLSLRRATRQGVHCRGSPRDFYPRSPCGERPRIHSTLPGHPGISIHALLAESDNLSDIRMKFFSVFLSTLSLRRATDIDLTEFNKAVFLSTLSLRRATRQGVHCRGSPRDFYPRSPCGERPEKMKVGGIDVSFLSTLSLRRATDFCRSAL